MEPASLTPMMSDALVILGAAGIVIPLFARLRITPVIGFILIGLLVGPFGLGRLVSDVPWLFYVTISDAAALEPYAQFGIVLLLFTIGLELSFNRLWTMRRLVFGLGSLELIVIGILLAVLLASIGQSWGSAVSMGLALAMSSTALVLPISGTQTAVGKAALSMLLFESIALVPIIFVMGAMAPYAQAEGIDGLIRTLWMGGAVIVGMLILGRTVLVRFFAEAARTKSPEVFLAATLLVVVGSSVATTLVGLSPIVGALLAGVLIAETEYNAEVLVIMEPFKGLALGIFLITVGMSIDFMVIAQQIGWIVGAVVGVLVLKAIITALLLRLMGARRGTATETGILMASPSEDTLIIISAASAALLITPQVAQFWQIVTAIGLTITPLLAMLGRHIGNRVDPVAVISDEEEIDVMAARVIVVGCGRVGQLVAQMLDRHGKPYLAVDPDADLVDRCKREGYHAVFGNAARKDVLVRLGIDRAPAVILTMDEPILAQNLTRKLRATYPDLPIIARARDSSHAAELYRAGATTAVPETLEASLQLSEAVLADLGVAMGPVIASIHEKRDEFREKIKLSADLLEKPKLRTGTVDS
jgi:CPA2 family monovalent cation:H+ antiporter-2